jgi:transposase
VRFSPWVRLIDRETKKRGAPYSVEVRPQVIAMVEAGASYREVAAHYGVSQSAVGKWMLRYRRTGSAAAKPAGGNRMSLLDKERDWISARLAAEPDLPPSQLHRELCARGIRVGMSTVARLLRRIEM